jgi:hypothetical protein
MYHVPQSLMKPRDPLPDPRPTKEDGRYQPIEPDPEGWLLRSSQLDLTFRLVPLATPVSSWHYVLKHRATPDHALAQLFANCSVTSSIHLDVNGQLHCHVDEVYIGPVGPIDKSRLDKPRLDDLARSA